MTVINEHHIEAHMASGHIITLKDDISIDN